MLDRVFIVGAIRTPIGKLGGALKNTEGVELAAKLMKELVTRTGVDPQAVNEVHLGCCTNCEAKEPVAPVIARQALLKAGLPVGIYSSTIDRACCSGSGAIQAGWRAIKSGEADVVIAGGVEILSRTPYIVRRLRDGIKLGNGVMEDPLYPLGYKDYNPVAVDAGEVALEYGVSREEQDVWAYHSQMKYQTALKADKFKDEIVPIQVNDGKGGFKEFSEDEFPKADTTLEGLRKLPTVFGSPTATAGNAPGLNDGASMLLLVSERKLQELKLEALAEILGVESYAESPKHIATVPARAISKMLHKYEYNMDQIDLLEINEAFAAMPLVCSKILGENDEAKITAIRNKINVNGGAIAMGHPVGQTGARIVVTLLHELRRRGGGLGIAAICGGLAQGDAILIKA